jgi:gliding motility-associated-like protein
MYQKIKYIVIIVLLPLFATAQLEADHWVFGIYKYVTFNKATQPTAEDYPSIRAPFPTGTTTYSDANGQLLFYSDGFGFNNRTFNLSPATDPTTFTNGQIGTLLSGTSFNFCQTVLAVPYPDKDSLYLLFHINYGVANNFTPVLLYSLINMKADSGRGDVDRVQRNIPVFGADTNVLFKLTAILHCNKKDIWVIGHLANSDKYFSILITGNGISNTRFFSAGDYINTPFGGGANLGHQNLDGAVKVSPLGNRIAAAFKGYNNVELGDFNTQTGIISGLKKLIAAPPHADTVYWFLNAKRYGPVGVEFSPTGDRLYVNSTYDVNGSEGPHYTQFLYQFDASLPTATQVQNSRYFVDSIYHKVGGAIQLANNGKMYVNVQDHLSEVANPENLGATCDYTRLTVLAGGQAANLGLPIFLQSYLRYPIIATGNCQFQNISFNIQNPAGISSVAWDFGDPASGVNNTSSLLNPTHIFTTQGIYLVKAVLQNANGCGADTIKKVINAGPFKIYLGKDTALCQGDTLQLSMNIPYASNVWSNNSNDTIIKITQPGTYWVRVNLGDCYTADTIVVAFNNLPQFTLGNDSVICNNSTVTLQPDLVYNNAVYLWNTNAGTTAITTSNAGDYWLRITDINGCKWRDTIKVTFKTLPGFNLGIDTSICTNDTLLLNATTSGTNSYLWNNGITSPILKVFQQNIYWCDVSKDGCTFRDSLTLGIKPLPLVNFGNDISLCEDNTLLLDATNTNATYLWQDASTNSSYLVKQKGQYRVKVTMNGCITKDTINIEYNLKPKFSLGTDSRICQGSKIILNPQISGASYLWQDGSTNPTYTVTQPGLYSLTATNNCGPATDNITIGNGICDLYVPNSFTPNGDTKNDLFKASYGDNVTEFRLQVYNRYGQIVFETRDKNKGWNGTFLGSKQPFGAYAWMIQYKSIVNSNWQKLQGTVLLIQ